MMKFIFLVSLCALSLSVQAAVVNLDFEQAPTSQTGTSYVDKGFVITQSNAFTIGRQSENFFCTVGQAPNGPTDYLCTMNNSPYPPIEMDFVRDDGGAFDLLEMDLYVVDSNCGDLGGCRSDALSVSAWNSEGGLIAQESLSFSVDGIGWHTLSFGAEWVNISRVTVDPQDELAWEAGEFVFVDNIRANVVPIPAAVWLFGSGLGLLGWLRRRQAA